MSLFNSGKTVLAVGLLNGAATMALYYSLGGMPAVLGYKIACTVFDSWNITSILRNSFSSCRISRRLRLHEVERHRDCEIDRTWAVGGSLLLTTFLGFMTWRKNWADPLSSPYMDGGSILLSMLGSFVFARDNQNLKSYDRHYTAYPALLLPPPPFVHPNAAVAIRNGIVSRISPRQNIV